LSLAVNELRVSHPRAGGLSNDDEVVATFHLIKLVFEASFTVVFCSRELDIGVRQEYMRGNDVKVFDRGGMYLKRLATDNRGVQCALFGDLLIVGKYYFTRIRLGVDIDEKNVFTFVGKAPQRGKYLWMSCQFRPSGWRLR
jgi:hypothetical protein